MGDDYVTIVFSVVEPIDFVLGDYCDLEGFGRFELVEPYKPTYNTSTGAWDYELKLEAQHQKWRNKIMRFLPQVGATECSFSLTAEPSVHMSQVLANITALAEESDFYLFHDGENTNEYTYSIDGDVDVSAKFVSYDHVNIIDALTSIAETYDCEWWLEGRVIRLGKCERNNDYVDLRLGDNVSNITVNNSTETLATRILPYGSTRNISPRYRRVLIFDVKSTTESTQGLQRVSDTNRPLLAEWFDAGLITVGSKPSDYLKLKYKFSLSQTFTSAYAQSVVLHTATAGIGDLGTGNWSLGLSDLVVRMSWKNRSGQIYDGTIKATLKGTIKSTGEPFQAEQITNITLPGDSGSIQPTPTDLSVKVESELTDVTTEIEFALRFQTSGSIWVSLDTMQSGEISFGYTSDRNRIEGVLMQVLDNDGNIAYTIENCVFNPDYGTLQSERNWIELPASYSLTTNDRFMLPQLKRHKVKSSYFTSKYALYKSLTSVVTSGVVTSRLMLPESLGVPYIDVKEGMSLQEAVEDVVTFEDIYPKMISTVREVSTTERTDTAENDDDTVSRPTFTAYIVKDFFWNTEHVFSLDYMIDGTDLQVTFQDGYRYTEDDIYPKSTEHPNGRGGYLSFTDDNGDPIPVREKAKVGELHNPDSGKLNGWTFVVDWSKDSDGSAKFELNRDDNGLIPCEAIHPEPFDQFVLTGLDVSIVDEVYTEEAEQELYEKAVEYVAKLNTDTSTYDCEMMPDAMYAGLSLVLGTRINLFYEGTIPTTTDDNGKLWGRKSRIIGYEIPLDYPCNSPIYKVGEKATYSRFGEIEDNIDALNHAMNAVKASASSSGISTSSNSPYIITQNDPTTPTDSNLFSALRTKVDFCGKKVSETIQSLWNFAAGLTVGDYNGDRGVLMDADGDVDVVTLIAQSLLRSPSFRSGFSGEGWQLWLENGLSHLEVDRLTVRQIMNVFELVIDKIRAVGGQIIVSAANGKIQEISESDKAYAITFEDSNCFQPHDLLRCQIFTGSDLRSYWVEVDSVEGDSVVILKSEFVGWSTPKVGDEVVLMGNTTDTSRQNLISISATDDGQPRIDVLNGVSSKSFEGGLRARLGNLDGINDSWFPADNQPHGDGLYADNAYLRGTFLLATGEDVKTLFEIVEGKIQSSIESIRQDSEDELECLNNSSFASGFTDWEVVSNTTFFQLGTSWLWVNDAPLSIFNTGTRLYWENGRPILVLRNSYILQYLANFRNVPTLNDGTPCSVTLTLSYRVVSAGTLSVGFNGMTTAGYEDASKVLHADLSLDVTEDFQRFSLNGLWNATGNFRLSFTGEIEIYGLSLKYDKTESLAYAYRTLFEQSDRLVKFAAQALDENGNVTEESGLVLKAEGGGLYAQDADGNIALIGVATKTADAEGNKQSYIYLTADNIQLEGLVTANENFKILTDGSIVAKNGTFNGTINADAGEIGGFTITNTSISATGGYSSVSGTSNLTSSSRFFLYSAGNPFLGFSDTDKWVGLGLDVLPAGTAVGACLLRVENETENTYYDNYGALIRVSGGRNNIGILLYGDIRANASKHHILNGNVVLNADSELRIASNMASDGGYTTYYTGVNLTDESLSNKVVTVRNGIIVSVN
ncbi:MAG: phage tail protein [Bacteroidales bacterium]|nr:phage tail protein [Bacteroidales bacterium]